MLGVLLRTHCEEQSDMQRSFCTALSQTVTDETVCATLRTNANVHGMLGVLLRTPTDTHTHCEHECEAAMYFQVHALEPMATVMSPLHRDQHAKVRMSIHVVLGFLLRTPPRTASLDTVRQEREPNHNS